MFESSHAYPQALVRRQKALRALVQPTRMLRAVFAFTTEKGFLLAEVDARELAEVANLRPSRADAALERLVAAGVVFARCEGPCCLLLGVPPEEFFWNDDPPDVAVDLFLPVVETKEATER